MKMHSVPVYIRYYQVVYKRKTVNVSWEVFIWYLVVSAVYIKYIYGAGSQRRPYLFVQHVISKESLLVYTKSIS